ncbi:MAG: metal-dependent phosphohydrolase [Nitrospirota bacterium]|nr:MAG: metal-dependent phosphohydrolase [Nitrospirota bacterium]
MLNPTKILAEALGNHLENYYVAMFGPVEPTYPAMLNLAARTILEVIANSDAPYHNVQHTMLVTLVGQEILRGKHLQERQTPDDWLHYISALLCHDIGYVRGVCSGDTTHSFVIDEAGNRITPPRGATDAFLTPYHVDRGKIFVRERGGPIPFLDEERVARTIELTRFPIPDTSDHQETNTEAGLVRAADLIGQLADPEHLQKLSSLYHEFVETGTDKILGIDSAADLADQYPKFYWNAVQPYIRDAIRYLELTQDGKQWLANLYSHVFAIEHKQFRFGPHQGKESIDRSKQP